MFSSNDPTEKLHPSAAAPSPSFWRTVELTVTHHFQEVLLWQVLEPDPGGVCSDVYSQLSAKKIHMQ